MLIKLAALSALGYGAYRYLQGARAAPASAGDRRIALAGGPLSDNASLRHDTQPNADWPSADQPGRSHGHLL